MAEDFHAAFGLGCDDATIGTIDADGVALAAIQALNERLEERGAQIEALRNDIAGKDVEINELRGRFAKLEALVIELAAK